MRLDGNYFASSRIGVRRSDQVHGPDARPELEVKAFHKRPADAKSKRKYNKNCLRNVSILLAVRTLTIKKTPKQNHSHSRYL